MAQGRLGSGRQGPRLAAGLAGLAGLLLALAACDQGAREKNGDGRKAGQKVHLVEVVTVRSEPLRHETVRTGTPSGSTAMAPLWVRTPVAIALAEAAESVGSSMKFPNCAQIFSAS